MKPSKIAKTLPKSSKFLKPSSIRKSSKPLASKSSAKKPQTPLPPPLPSPPNEVYSSDPTPYTTAATPERTQQNIETTFFQTFHSATKHTESSIKNGVRGLFAATSIRPGDIISEIEAKTAVTESAARVSVPGQCLESLFQSSLTYFFSQQNFHTNDDDNDSADSDQEELQTKSIKIKSPLSECFFDEFGAPFTTPGHVMLFLYLISLRFGQDIMVSENQQQKTTQNMTSSTPIPPPTSHPIPPSFIHPDLVEFHQYLLQNPPSTPSPTHSPPQSSTPPSKSTSTFNSEQRIHQIYAQWLPSTYSLPICWPASLMYQTGFHTSDMYKSTQHRISHLHKLYFTIFPLLFSIFPQVFNKEIFSFERFVWAYSAYTSRSFPSHFIQHFSVVQQLHKLNQNFMYPSTKENNNEIHDISLCGVMLPYMDLTNHSNYHEIHWLAGPHSHSQSTNMKKIQSNEQKSQNIVVNVCVDEIGRQILGISSSSIQSANSKTPTSLNSSPVPTFLKECISIHNNANTRGIHPTIISPNFVFSFFPPSQTNPTLPSSTQISTFHSQFYPTTPSTSTTTPQLNYNGTVQGDHISYQACVQYNEGDEVFNNYGPKTQDELLFGYGFILEQFSPSLLRAPINLDSISSPPSNPQPKSEITSPLHPHSITFSPNNVVMVQLPKPPSTTSSIHTTIINNFITSLSTTLPQGFLRTNFLNNPYLFELTSEGLPQGITTMFSLLTLTNIDCDTISCLLPLSSSSSSSSQSPSPAQIQRILPTHVVQNGFFGILQQLFRKMQLLHISTLSTSYHHCSTYPNNNNSTDTLVSQRTQLVDLFFPKFLNNPLSHCSLFQKFFPHLFQMFSTSTLLDIIHLIVSIPFAAPQLYEFFQQQQQHFQQQLQPNNTSTKSTKFQSTSQQPSQFSEPLHILNIPMIFGSPTLTKLFPNSNNSANQQTSTSSPTLFSENQYYDVYCALFYKITQSTILFSSIEHSLELFQNFSSTSTLNNNTSISNFTNSLHSHQPPTQSLPTPHPLFQSWSQACHSCSNVLQSVLPNAPHITKFHTNIFYSQSNLWYLSPIPSLQHTNSLLYIPNILAITTRQTLSLQFFESEFQLQQDQRDAERSYQLTLLQQQSQSKSRTKQTKNQIPCQPLLQSPLSFLKLNNLASFPPIHVIITKIKQETMEVLGGSDAYIELSLLLLHLHFRFTYYSHHYPLIWETLEHQGRNDQDEIVIDENMINSIVHADDLNLAHVISNASKSSQNDDQNDQQEDNDDYNAVLQVAAKLSFLRDLLSPIEFSLYILWNPILSRHLPQFNLKDMRPDDDQDDQNHDNEMTTDDSISIQHCYDQISIPNDQSAFDLPSSSMNDEIESTLQNNFNFECILGKNQFLLFDQHNTSLLSSCLCSEHESPLETTSNRDCVDCTQCCGISPTIASRTIMSEKDIISMVLDMVSTITTNLNADLVQMLNPANNKGIVHNDNDDENMMMMQNAKILFNQAVQEFPYFFPSFPSVTQLNNSLHLIHQLKSDTGVDMQLIPLPFPLQKSHVLPFHSSSAALPVSSLSDSNGSTTFGEVEQNSITAYSVHVQQSTGYSLITPMIDLDQLDMGHDEDDREESDEKNSNPSLHPVFTTPIIFSLNTQISSMSPHCAAAHDGLVVDSCTNSNNSLLFEKWSTQYNSYLSSLSSQQSLSSSSQSKITLPIEKTHTNNQNGKMNGKNKKSQKNSSQEEDVVISSPRVNDPSDIALRFNLNHYCHIFSTFFAKLPTALQRQIIPSSTPSKSLSPLSIFLEHNTIAITLKPQTSKSIPTTISFPFLPSPTYTMCTKWFINSLLDLSRNGFSILNMLSPQQLTQQSSSQNLSIHPIDFTTIKNPSDINLSVLPQYVVEWCQGYDNNSVFNTLKSFHPIFAQPHISFPSTMSISTSFADPRSNSLVKQHDEVQTNDPNQLVSLSQPTQLQSSPHHIPPTLPDHILLICIQLIQCAANVVDNEEDIDFGFDFGATNSTDTEDSVSIINPTVHPTKCGNKNIKTNKKVEFESNPNNTNKTIPSLPTASEMQVLVESQELANSSDAQVGIESLYTSIQQIRRNCGNTTTTSSQSTSIPTPQTEQQIKSIETTRWKTAIQAIIVKRIFSHVSILIKILTDVGLTQSERLFNQQPIDSTKKSGKQTPKSDELDFQQLLAMIFSASSSHQSYQPLVVYHILSISTLVSIVVSKK